MTDDLTAIAKRHSRRAFTAEPISLDTACKLHDFIEEINREASANIRLITNNGDAFNAVLKTYGYFAGVNNYFVIVSKKENRRSQIMSGYYGEKVVLYCTKLGLNTCWVGALFDKNSCPVAVADDEEVLAVIAVGYSPPRSTIQENLIRVMIAPYKKKVYELFESEDNRPIPEWFEHGVAAVAKAPSAWNRQPVKFIYRKDGTVSAMITYDDKMSGIDLGIAKLHFELGSGRKLS